MIAHALMAATVMAAGSLSLSPSAKAASIETAEAACAAAKVAVAARAHIAVSVIASCDVIGAADSPPGYYYILALHSARECEGICSTSMGWYAVQKATGRVFEWNVAGEKLGAPI